MTSTSYPENRQDWRGRFIADLAEGLSRRSDIGLALWAPPGDAVPAITRAATVEEAAWLQRLSRHGGIAHLLRNDKLLAVGMAAGLLARLRRVYRRDRADVMHINWLQNALPLWGSRTPAVVSVLGTDFGLLRLPGMKRLLRSVFKQRRTILAPNAEWMSAVLENAFGDIAEIRPVVFGIDEAWYKLQRVPSEDKPHHWLAVTRLTRKKIGDLFDWGGGLFGAGRILHLFGPMQEDITLPDWVKYHGPTHPADLSANWFPMASGLITLSRHDEGRPQVVLEAMAAGLPVIASDLPAHRDIIRDRQTGWLVASRDDLQGALAQLELPRQNRMVGDAARAWAREEIGTWDDCAARYAVLYTRLLKAQR